MKYLILIMIMNLHLLADYNISCKGETQHNYISNFSNYSSAFWGEPDGEYVEGEIDFVNNYAFFVDNRSATCGGSEDKHITVEAYCKYNVSGCWDNLHGVSDNPLVSFNNETSKFQNEVTVVNGLPCVDVSTLPFTFTYGIYSENDSNFDIPFGHSKISHIADTYETLLNGDEAKTLRAVCGTAEPETGKDYSAQLDTLIDNTSENKNISEINERDKKLDSDLDNFTENFKIESAEESQLQMDEFTQTFETTLSDSFESYGDVFGFGGYGEAPEAIVFSMFDKEYEVFNITTIDPHLDLIRNSFLLFAYLWGFIIVFRTI